MTNPSSKDNMSNATMSMAGPSKRSDDESSSSLSTNSLLFISRRDIGPILLMFFFVFLGVAGSLICYFTINLRDNYNIQQGLNEDMYKVTEKIQNAFQEVLDSTGSVQRYFETTRNNTLVDYQKQWLKFVDPEGPNSFFPYISRVDYAPLVINAQLPGYIQAQHAKGGPYSSYAIYSQDSTGHDVSVNKSAPFFLPVMLSAPEGNENWFGFDYYSNPDISDDIKRAISYGQSTLSSSMFNDTSGEAFNMIVFPLFDIDTKQLNGAVFGYVVLNTLMNEAVDASLLDEGVGLSLYSLNFTNNSQGSFAYSSKGLDPDGAAADISAASFVSQGIINLDDGYFRAVLSSGSEYIASRTPVDKYVAIPVICVGCVMLLIFAVFLLFVNRLIRAARSRTRNKKKLTDLKETQQSTKVLLDRIVKQEARIRICLNCIPEFLAMVSMNGKVMHTNSLFDGVFGYSEQKLEQGLTITWIFPKLGYNFFKDDEMMSDTNATKWIEAKGVTAEEKEVNVSFSIRSLLTEPAAFRADILTEITLLSDKSEDVEAYVIIGRVIAM
jgi:PAS domain-containing protein